MTPKNEVSQDLEFEEQISGFSMEGKFLARQISDFCDRQELHDTRIKSLENRDNKMLGLSGLLSAIVSGIISYFAPK